jgi:hypothetical protein
MLVDNLFQWAVKGGGQAFSIRGLSLVHWPCLKR